MISKNQIKLIRSLKQKKYRQKYNKFICEGSKIIDELIAFRSDLIDRIYMTTKGASKLSQQLPSRLVTVDQKILSEISSLSTNQDGLAIVEIPKQTPFENAPDFGFFLDGVRDPGNLGTIMRICDWFGFKRLFLSSDCVDVYNPKVIQASMGSLFRVSCEVVELLSLKEKYDLQMVGASMSGKDYRDWSPRKGSLIVLGSESNGMKLSTEQLLDETITIPRIGESTESLNVAVACGILSAKLVERIH